ncbi:hypothetical protein MASR2M78_17230 [Treponema sp.]
MNTVPFIKNGLRALLFTLLLSLLALPSFAQATDATANAEADFEAALFGMGENAAEGDGAGGTSEVSSVFDNFSINTQSEDIARTEYLVGGTVVARAGGTLLGGGDGYIVNSGASGKLFGKVSVPDYGALYIAYNIAHDFFQGADVEGQSPPASDPYEPRYALSELHYSFDIDKKVFIRLGNQLIAWGPSRIWTPVDFINLEKADAFSEIDARQGKPALRIHVPFRSSNIFLFTDFSEMSDNGSVGDPVERAKLGGRFDFTGGDFEFGASAYGGKESQVRFGLDASGRLLGMTVYGEGAYAPNYDDYSASFLASLGFSRSLGELKRWTLSSETFYNSRGKSLKKYDAISYQALDADKKTPLYQGELYTYLALSADKLFSDYLSTTASALANFSELSYNIKLAESISLPRAVPFTVSLNYYGGPKNTEFTRFAGDGAVSLSLTSRLEF